MKTRFKAPFFLAMLIGGFVLIPASQVTAQNYQAWPVTQIAAGSGHTLFTKSDGSLWVMGDNSAGQLGLGPTITNVNVPQQIVSNGVVLLAVGFQHSLFKKSDGSLWGMGTNGSGQLGLGATVTSATVPQQIMSGGVGLIAAGGDHSLFTGGGPPRLWVMGDNTYGQLGDGTYTDHYVPEAVFQPSGTRAGFIAVAAGASHSLFATVNTSGRVLWGMGNNGASQLGIAPDIQSTNVPQQIPSYGGLGTVIAAGLDYSFFIETNGDLWAWGDNEYGKLGAGSENEEVQAPYAVFGPEIHVPDIPVVAIAGGYEHSLLVLSDGSLWGMGDNESGELGVGFAGYYTDKPEEIEASNVVAVAAGNGFSLFIKSDGSLWGMGYNGNGQLGTGDYTDRFTPVEIVSPPPQISILPYGANVILAWPSNAAAFVLQSTTNLASPNWTTVSPSPIIVGNQCEVFTPSSGTQQFYRLMLSQ